MSCSVTNEPARELNRRTSWPPSLFNSLPIELIWEISGRVSKRSYPILSCVSKHFRSILLSPEIHKIRSELDKDSLFISFLDESKTPIIRNWFTLRTIKKQNQFVSVSIPFDYISQPNPSIIAIGPEIFFICGSYIPSSRLWIFDTRSQMFRRGPNMLVNRCYKSVGLVGNKVYVIGGDRGYKIQAESFDVKTQTWEQAHDPEGEEEYFPWISSVNVSLDKKVYALISYDDKAIHYDTRDGSCGSLKLVKDKWWTSGVCVMENVLYVYYQRFGLMWYDFEMMLWRVVYGLDVVNKVGCVGMAKYYGKLAFLWEEDGDGGVSSESKEIWCRMIGLVRSEQGIHGIAEPSQVLGIVPRGYRMHQCLSVSD